MFIRKKRSIKQIGAIMPFSFQEKIFSFVFNIALESGENNLVRTFIADLSNAKQVILQIFNKVDSFYLNLGVEMNAFWWEGALAGR